MIGGGSSPPPLDDLDPVQKAEVNGEPTAKLVSVPRAKVSGESSRRRNVCILVDDEFLSLRRQKAKNFRGAPGTNTQWTGQSCCTLDPGVKVFTDCHPKCAVIAFGLRADTVRDYQSLAVRWTVLTLVGRSRAITPALIRHRWRSETLFLEGSREIRRYHR
ncbi:hypothetical protein CSAL01_05402 [Colletotrichum salicis]|uniref:Uncharacterized protein n=1 Tax=Colletotrichum salicis TaxID=1209931 RepID=A0A135V9A4_9PEZI|nr:hypothetical protein CSAL01_05402 [Colletotrichum salicis]